MSEQKFKEGDVVVCVDANPHHNELTLGKEYIVDNLRCRKEVCITNDQGKTMSYFNSRFKKKEENRMQNDQRAKKRQLKVGDTVRVLDNAEEVMKARRDLGWEDSMQPAVGNVFKVEYVYSDGEQIELENNFWAWSPDCLELVEEEQPAVKKEKSNIVSGVFHLENKMTVAYEYDKVLERFKLGIAHCNPKDTFNKKVGISTAKGYLLVSPEVISLSMLRRLTGIKLGKKDNVWDDTCKHVKDYLPAVFRSLYNL